MGIIETFVTALALAMDAFAVSLGIGACISHTSWLPALRMGSACGSLQALMPVAGWFMGKKFLIMIKSLDHWIAFIILLVIGIRMIHESREETKCYTVDPTTGKTLLFLAIATSIDALAVGVSLGTLGNPVIFLSVSTGIITAILSISGVHMGNRLGVILGKKMEMGGGALLCLIGLRILITHLF